MACSSRPSPSRNGESNVSTSSAGAPYFAVSIAFMSRYACLAFLSGGKRGTLNFATPPLEDRKSTRLNSSHGYISYGLFFFKKKTMLDPPLHHPLQQGTVRP